MVNKKEKILKYLKKNKQTATGKIALMIKSNQWMAEKYLEELEKENKIKRFKTPIATYWELI